MDFQTERLRDRVRPASDAEREAAREVLESLSRPRLAGSTGAEEVAADLRARFEELGYEVRELPFSFSAFPGRAGVPTAGSVLFIAAVAAVVLLLLERPISATVVLAVAGAVFAGLGLSFRTMIRRLPWLRVETANWLVARPEARPRYLVAAHRDSKSQPISLRTRVAGVILAAAGWILLLVLAVGAMLMPWTPGMYTILIIGSVTVVGSIALVLSWVDNESPGALDNGSGLAALLALAERLKEEEGVGFLVTDGEELGLAGALEAHRHLPPVAGVINLDGLDDDGPTRLFERHGLLPRGRAPHLLAAFLAAASALEIGFRRRDLPPGLMVEHAAYLRGGIPAVTVMRGDSGSLARVHRPIDTADRMSGFGIARVAALVDGAVRVLLSTEAPEPSEPLLRRSAS